MKRVPAIIVALGFSFGVAIAQTDTDADVASVDTNIADADTDPVAPAANDNNEISLFMVAPEQVNAGSVFEVQQTIRRKNVGDDIAALFRLNLPKGFEAEEVPGKSGGSVFSFADQQVRFHWKTLPLASDIVLIYRIRVVDIRLSGKIQLLGRFTYAVNDERQPAYEVESEVITVTPTCGPGEAIGIEIYRSGDFTPLVESSSSPSSSLAGRGDGFSLQQNVKNEHAEENIFVMRQKPYAVSNEYYVNLQITKGELTGFGRIEETLPSSQLVVEPVETKGAQFSMEGGSHLSFVWDTLPESEDFVIAYKISQMKEDPAVPLEIKGKFSFFIGNSLESVDIIERDVDFSSQVPVPPIDLGEVTPATPPAEEVNKRALAIERNKRQMRGVVFKVQLLATKTPIDIDVEFEQFKTEPIIQEKTPDPKGYVYKYVVGPYKRYEQAVQYRDKMWRKGIGDAFVTCYHNGERITIQEAFLITNNRKK